MDSAHAGKMLDGFGKFRDSFIRVAVLDAIAHTVVQMALQHNLADLMQGAFGGVDLHKDVLTGDILIHHFIDSVHLSDDFFQSAVKVHPVLGRQAL